MPLAAGVGVPRGPSDPLRVVLVGLDFKPRPGGIAEYSHRVAEGLAERGHEVRVLTPPAEGDAEYDARVPFAVRRLELGAWNPDDPRYQFSLYRAIREEIEDLEADWLIQNALGKATHAAWGAARRTGRPLCTFVHGSGIRIRRSPRPSDYDNLASWAVERSRLKMGAVWAQRVVTVSSFTRRNLEEAGVDPDRITLLPPHIPGAGEWDRDEARIEQLRDRYDVGQRPLLLTVSRLTERKGIDTVLRALHERREDLPDVRYVVAGDGSDRERLDGLVEELGLEEVVVFAGFVDEQEKHDLYEAASIFVMPNRELADGDVEGFGIVFLEANAHGTPVVGGRSGGALDAVVDGETGFLVDPQHPSAVAEALAKLLGDPQLREELGEGGRRRVEEKLDFEANLEGLIEDLRAHRS